MPGVRFTAVATLYVPLLLGVFAGCGEASVQSAGIVASKPTPNDASASLKADSTENSQDSAPKVGLRHSTEDEGIVVSAAACAETSAQGNGNESAAAATGSQKSGKESALCAKATDRTATR